VTSLRLLHYNLACSPDKENPVSSVHPKTFSDIDRYGHLPLRRELCHLEDTLRLRFFDCHLGLQAFCPRQERLGQVLFAFPYQ